MPRRRFERARWTWPYAWRSQRRFRNSCASSLPPNTASISSIGIVATSNGERESVRYSDCASLVRQPRIGDWAGAVAPLGAELDAILSTHRAVHSPEDCQCNE